MDSQSTEERAEKVIIALTPEQLKDICANAAEIGAKEALKTYDQERKKEQGKRADRRLRNTTTGLCPDTSENRRDTGRKAGTL